MKKGEKLNLKRKMIVIKTIKCSLRFKIFIFYQKAWYLVEDSF